MGSIPNAGRPYVRILNPIWAVEFTTQYRLTPSGKLNAKNANISGSITFIICCCARALSSVAVVTVVFDCTHVVAPTRTTKT
jgi:hypothetical protein